MHSTTKMFFTIIIIYKNKYLWEDTLIIQNLNIVEDYRIGVHRGEKFKNIEISSLT